MQRFLHTCDTLSRDMWCVPGIGKGPPPAGCWTGICTGLSPALFYEHMKLHFCGLCAGQIHVPMGQKQHRHPSELVGYCKAG